MEAIDTKAIKDAVSQKYGFKSFVDMIVVSHRYQNPDKTANTITTIISEVISEVAKQVAEAQKQNCKDFIFGNMIYPEYRETVYNGILNAPIPEII